MERNALARSRAYSLFSELFQVGLKAETLAIIRDVPDLWEAMPGEFLTDEEVFNEDAAAAAHFSLFGFNVFPYESVFLDSEIMLEGRVTQDVQIFYSRAGVDTAWENESPDHIAQELRFLASLCAAEAEYLENDLRSEVIRIRDLQRNFLENHLLLWLPVFVIAIRQHEHSFYTELADLTVELTISHWEGLVGDSKSRPPRVSLPSLPRLLDDKRTGIKEISHYLLTPVYSGFYLSRSEITKLAKANQLIHGFGSREQMFTNLLRAASEYGAFPPLLHGIEANLDKWQSEYQRLLTNEALPTNYGKLWLGRLDESRLILAAIEKAVLEIV